MEETMARRRGSGSSDQANGADASKVPLDATILDLKAALESVPPKQGAKDEPKAAPQETSKQDDGLELQLSDLKAQLEAKDTLIAKLQTEAQQAEQLRSELAEAKQMILKLSEVNAKPLATIPTAHVAPPKAEPKPEPKAEIKPAPRPTLQIEPSEPARHSKHETALRKILEHPTQPGLPPSMPSESEGKITEIEIGWMD
jgi:hypothetical protein